MAQDPVEAMRLVCLSHNEYVGPDRTLTFEVRVENAADRELEASVGGYIDGVLAGETGFRSFPSLSSGSFSFDVPVERSDGDYPVSIGFTAAREA